MASNTTQIDARSLRVKPQVSNGSTVHLEDVDGRTAIARRFRDLLHQTLADMGAEPPDRNRGLAFGHNLSVAQHQLARRCVALCVECERLESQFVTNGQATPAELDLYGRTASTLRRLFEGLGLEARTFDDDSDGYLQRQQDMMNELARLNE